MAEKLLRMNNITARTRAFADEQAANKYFAIKNILPTGRAHYANSSFYSKIFCEDLSSYLNYEIEKCDVQFDDIYDSVLKNTYNLTKLER